MPALTSLRAALFGPSTADRLLEVLREDRAAQTTLLVSLIDSIRAQSDLAKRQLDLLAAPAGTPEVRVMTDADEARYERERLSHKADPSTLRTLDPEALFDDLARDFADDSRQGL